MKSREEHREKLARALDLCCELTGTPWQEAAKAAVLDDLSVYDTQAVLDALERCRRELSEPLTLAAVLSRLDNGLPTAEEAFALLAAAWNDEGMTAVLPEAAMAAAEGALPLWRAGDAAGARTVFTQTYDRLSRRQPVRWVLSLGHDPSRRRQAVCEAVRLGRLPAARLAELPPDGEEADIEGQRRVLQAVGKLLNRP